MPVRKLIVVLAAFLALEPVALADLTDQLKSRPEITPQARVDLIRALNAELVFLRKPLPSGKEGYTIHPGGKIEPDERELAIALANHGMAATSGDRVVITNIEFKGNSIIFEINGGPKKKKKWWQRITISGLGGSVQAPQPEQDVRGSSVALEFNKRIPEVSPDEVKQLLAPVLDFTAHSAAELYVETLPPHVKEAIKDHRALVGMDEELVIMAKGRPERKIRERDEQGQPYEEWLYGVPPDDVEFIRFQGEEVVQVKIMRVDGERIVRTEKEVDMAALKNTSAQASSAAAEPGQEKKPAKRPTLRRPDDPEPPLGPPGMPPRTDPRDQLPPPNRAY